MRALLRLLCGVAFVLVLAGCRVDTVIDIAVDADGSGTLTVDAAFDAEATEALGGFEAVLLADLSTAGWQLEGPTPDGLGGVGLVATIPFADEEALAAALDQIAGPRVFDDVRITSADAFAERTQSLTLDVDLRRGWELFSDAGVAAALDGEPFGVPIEQLTGGRTIDEVIGVSISASVAADDDEAPAVSSWAPRFGDVSTTRIELQAQVENSTAVLLRWIGTALLSLFVLSIVLAVLGLWLERRAERSRPAPRPKGLASRIPGRGTGDGDAAPRPRGGAAADEGPVRLVIVEPLSVLYLQGESQQNYLLPFVRHNGGEARADVILGAYDQVIRGRVPTDELWQAAGLPTTTQDIDEVFSSMRRLRKDTPMFLKELERRRIPIAAVSNDVEVWADLARTRDRLTAVWPWIVSSELGTAKPDPGMFERLRRETGVAYGHCLYIDTDLANLDAAAELGMRTALYDADGLDLPDVVGHVVVKNLLSLVRRA